MKTNIINDIDVNASNVTALLNVVPIILMLAPLYYIWYRWFAKDIPFEDYDTLEPEIILKRRFAKGEINVYEYTERMARL